MYRIGHYGGALLAYAPVAFLLVASGFRLLAVAGGLLTVGLSTFPDVDFRIPFVRHRGLTHTIWFALVVGIGLGGAGYLLGDTLGVVPQVTLAGFGFVVGFVAIVSHIAADALTPAGVRPLAPLHSRRYTYSVTKAKNDVANYTLLALGGLVAAGAFVLGNDVTGAIP